MKRDGGSVGVRTLILLVLSFFLGSPARAQSPAVDGQWSGPFGLPLIAIHSSLLPTGQVLLFSAEHGVPGIHAWILDPLTLGLNNVPPPAGWNLDCAGHSYLPDGRLLVAGGTLRFNPLLGSDRAYLFDPFSSQWVRIEDMADGRWYPTNVTLPDGRILTMSGIDGTTGALNSDIELWDPNGSSNWELLGQRLVPDYPNLHVMPDGLVFRSGPDRQTETLDPGNMVWTPVAATNFPARYEAPSVLLPPTLDRVMLMGGYVEPNGVPTASVETIDLAVPSPAWTLGPGMQFARIQHNAVLLPTGRVLVVGGRSDAPGGVADSVMVPEIFDPVTSTWDPVAPHRVARMYHSTALLLPDGRVLAAGGDYRPSGEIYSPPYLFRGPRPTIGSAPAAIAYGQPFQISVAGGTGPYTTSLLGLSAVTHSNNMTQRYVRLGETPAAGTFSVPAPSSANLAPPGYYMLFVTDATGVPSVSRMVRLLTRFGDFNQDDTVDGADRDSFETCFTGPDAGPPGRRCEPGDFDADQDVDCEDWSAFLAAWTGAGTPSPLLSCQSTSAAPGAFSETKLALLPPWPNPSRGTVGFAFALPNRSVVRLTIHDVTGRLIAMLLDETRTPGFHSHHWNGTDRSGGKLSPGVYFVRVTAAGSSHSRLFVIGDS